METITKKEFWLGIAVITFSVAMWNLIEPPIIVTSPKIKIIKIEEVYCKTDKEGNVEVYEK